ncbi:MAG TPA: hypothetical protein PKW48_01205, partial [Deltaproteobacteria bacterium]|nr:hypothetical protein [Deltaproteobacteria bacterium]HRR70640.1 hypothetical protein [Desulfomonilia bacterium]
ESNATILPITSGLPIEIDNHEIMIIPNSSFTTPWPLNLFPAGEWRRLSTENEHCQRKKYLNKCFFQEDISE